MYLYFFAFADGNAQNVFVRNGIGVLLKVYAYAIIPLFVIVGSYFASQLVQHVFVDHHARLDAQFFAQVFGFRFAHAANGETRQSGALGNFNYQVNFIAFNLFGINADKRKETLLPEILYGQRNFITGNFNVLVK